MNRDPHSLPHMRRTAGDESYADGEQSHWDVYMRCVTSGGRVRIQTLALLLAESHCLARSPCTSLQQDRANRGDAALCVCRSAGSDVWTLAIRV